MAKRVNFFDGAQSSTVPVIGNIDATSLVQYANDAAYEADNAGSPIAGNIYFNTSLNLVRYYNGTAWQNVLDEQGTQTLQNKTIDGTDATGNNTVLTDADDVSFDNVVSGLSATNTQSAIDEVEGRLDTAEGLITDNSLDILDLENLSGSPGAADHGTFTGTTIPNNSNTKGALQSLETEVELKLDASEKGQPNGVAELDSGGKVPAAQLPSYVDDVLEFADLASFPGTGETGKIYVAIDTGKTYRWTGTVYVEISASDVNSVNGQTGNVVLDLEDINDVNITSVAAREQIRRNVANTEWENFNPDDSATDSATGSNATLSTVGTSIVSLTDVALTSIDMIPAGYSGQKFILTNKTGVTVLVNNETGATAINRILTGTGAAIELSDDASLYMYYNPVDNRWQVVGGTGSGGSGIQGIITGNNSSADATVGDWVTYQDAAQNTPEDGTGGTPNVTINRTTISNEILNGTGSFKLIKGAFDRQGEGTSLLLNVPKYLRGQPVKVSFSYQASNDFDFGSPSDPVGNPSDISVFLYDVTNSRLLSMNQPGIFGGGYYDSLTQIPSDCEQVRVILHIATTNANAYDFIFDKVQLVLAENEFVNADSDWISYTPTFTGFGTPTGVEFRYKRNGDSVLIEGQFIPGTTTATEARISLPLGLVSSPDYPAIQQVGEFFLNQSASQQGGLILIEPSVSYLTMTNQNLRYSGVAVSANAFAKTNANTFSSSILMSVRVNLPIKIVGWTSGTLHPAAIGLNARAVMRATKNGGSVTVGTAIANWTSTEKDSIAAFNATTGIYTVRSPGDYYVTSGTHQTPAGNGTPQIYINGVIFQNGFCDSGSTNVRGVSGIAVDLKYGDTIEIRFNTTVNFAASNLTTFAVYKLGSEAQPYAPRVAYIKDVKASGTAGGAFTSGAYQTRTLNSIEGDQSFVSLSSNQFTLQPGTYHIEAEAPAITVARHKAKLRNITDTTDTIIGTSEYSDNTSTYAQTRSKISGTFSISSAKTFEIQHQCLVTRATNGFGAASVFGDNEIYTTVKITKVL